MFTSLSARTEQTPQEPELRPPFRIKSMRHAVSTRNQGLRCSGTRGGLGPAYFVRPTSCAIQVHVVHSKFQATALPIGQKSVSLNVQASFGNESGAQCSESVRVCNQRENLGDFSLFTVETEPYDALKRADPCRFSCPSSRSVMVGFFSITQFWSDSFLLFVQMLSLLLLTIGVHSSHQPATELASDSSSSSIAESSTAQLVESRNLQS